MAELEAYKKYDQIKFLSEAQLKVDEAVVTIQKTTVANAADLNDANSTVSTARKTLDLEIEKLKDLQELRKEVERRRQEMRRELRLLEQVLGDDAESKRLQKYEQSLHEMTADELVAEMRILREEIEQLTETVARTALAEGERRFKVAGQVHNRFEWIDTDVTSGEGNLASLLRSRIRVIGGPPRENACALGGAGFAAVG